MRNAISALGAAPADLGVFLPYVLGALAVGALTPSNVLLAFGVMMIATGLYFRVPVPVQPMKAVSALIITGALSSADIIMVGLLLGLMLLILGSSNLIGAIARHVPHPVILGLQAGLGLSMLLLAGKLLIPKEGWQMLLDQPAGALFGLAGLLLLLLLMRFTRWPASLLLVGIAILLGPLFGLSQLPLLSAPSLTMPNWQMPDFSVTFHAFINGAMVQLPLTITNAVLVTAALAGDYYGQQAARATPRALALSTGLGNLLLAPFGAMPMCHGAGGLAAYHKFGARDGAPVALLGVLFLLIALFFAASATSLLQAVPIEAAASLLAIAAWQLFWPKQKPDFTHFDWLLLLLTLLLTILVNPAWGVGAGLLLHYLRLLAKQKLPARGEG